MREASLISHSARKPGAVAGYSLAGAAWLAIAGALSGLSAPALHGQLSPANVERHEGLWVRAALGLGGLSNTATYGSAGPYPGTALQLAGGWAVRPRAVLAAAFDRWSGLNLLDGDSKQRAHFLTLGALLYPTASTYVRIGAGRAWSDEASYAARGGALVAAVGHEFGRSQRRSVSLELTHLRSVGGRGIIAGERRSANPLVWVASIGVTLL